MDKDLKYLLTEQGAELKELYSEIDKLQGIIDKAINLNEQIKHFVYEYLLNYNITCSKLIYEYLEKQNKILRNN